MLPYADISIKFDIQYQVFNLEGVVLMEYRYLSDKTFFTAQLRIFLKVFDGTLFVIAVHSVFSIPKYFIFENGHIV